MFETDLVELLASHNIDCAKFGTGKAKTLDHLARELSSGESLLVERDGQLVRQLCVLAVNVFVDCSDGRLWLCEDRQEFNDGRVRRRHLDASVSEKLGPNEALDQALKRALSEELSITRFVQLSDFIATTKSSESPSFPGLLSEYVVSSVDVLIDTTEFRAEYVERQVDKSTYFVWMSPTLTTQTS